MIGLAGTAIGEHGDCSASRSPGKMTSSQRNQLCLVYLCSKNISTWVVQDKSYPIRPPFSAVFLLLGFPVNQPIFSLAPPPHGGEQL